MNRRTFLKKTAFGATGLMFDIQPNRKTRHLIFVVNGAARKKDYYEDPSLSPNIRGIAGDAFVFEEDHCDSVASHGAAFSELVGGLPAYRYLKSPSAQLVIDVLRNSNPGILVVHELNHEIGHNSYQEYRKVVQATDEKVGAIFQWLKADSHFADNTALVVRPEFGRDDVINSRGELHHSEGFYSSHRVASIFWGPDFNKGIERRAVINRKDIAPTLSSLFNCGAPGRCLAVPGLFSN